MRVMAVFPICLLLSSLDVAQSMVSLTAPNGQHPTTLAGWCKVARCQDIGGQRWVVIQSRTGREQGFFQGWDAYRTGFGQTTADHWLGLDAIHELCPPHRACHLRVEMTYKNVRHEKDCRYAQCVPRTPDGRYVALYRQFAVADHTEHFRLTIGGFDTSSTAGDELTPYALGAAFSTHDADHDGWDGGSWGSCSDEHGGGGGWWFGNRGGDGCGWSCLNGQYKWGSGLGLYWQSVAAAKSVEASRMLVRLVA